MRTLAIRFKPRITRASARVAASTLAAVLLAAASQAQAQVPFSVTFAPMPVQRVGLGLRLAVRESASGYVGQVPFTATIPPTYVRGAGLRRTVDACVMTGYLADGSVITMSIPPEPVFLRTARPVWTTVTVTAPDGSVLSGPVLLPRAKFRRGVVEQVTAAGVLR